MPFEQLLGNEQLKKDLTRSLRSGQAAHSYLISGPRGSGKRTLARLLAAGLHCTAEDKPCLKCRACRKVMEGVHPDFITWEDPDHQKLPVKMIREVFRPDVFIKPNESHRKVYLIPQELGLEGQNALLTVLEEPPEYAVFLLLCDNPEKLLPTVRSRCRELILTGLDRRTLLSQLEKEFPQLSPEQRQAAQERSGGFLGQARELILTGETASPQTEGFLRGFAQGDSLALVTTLAPMEKWKRDALIPVLQEWIRLLEEALVCRSGGLAASGPARQIAQSRTGEQIYAALMSLKKAVEYAQGNVSIGAVCGWLQFALRAK